MAQVNLCSYGFPQVLIGLLMGGNYDSSIFNAELLDAFLAILLKDCLSIFEKVMFKSKLKSLLFP